MNKPNYSVTTKYPLRIPELNTHSKGCGVAGCQQCEQAHPLADPHCLYCGGTGWLTNKFGKELQPCTGRGCHRDTLEGRAALTVFDRHTGVNRKKTFKNFLEIDGTGLALKASQEMANSEGNLAFLTILGGVGCGKTHLCYAIANVWLSRGLKVKMYPVDDLLAKLRHGIVDNSVEDLVNEAKEITALILDDFKQEYHSDWANSRLEEIINYRYSWLGFTVVTSNNTLQEFPERIASRLCEEPLAKVISNTAGDYRLIKHSINKPPVPEEFR